MRALALRLLLVLPFAAPVASAQTAPVSDQMLTWRTYDGTRTARVRVYVTSDRRRPHTAVVDEVVGDPDAFGGQGAITNEARYAAEFMARELRLDPARVTYVFRVPDGARPQAPPVLLRATFTQLRSGQLSSPAWRVISRDELDRLTDRGLY
ncbi:MAG: hypothetical protein ACK41D_00555 [Rubricoccaceae bacterium]